MHPISLLDTSFWSTAVRKLRVGSFDFAATSLCFRLLFSCIFHPKWSHFFSSYSLWLVIIFFTSKSSLLFFLSYHVVSHFPHVLVMAITSLIVCDWNPYKHIHTRFTVLNGHVPALRRYKSFILLLGSIVLVCSMV